MRGLVLSGLVLGLVLSSSAAQAVEVGARFKALAACGTLKPGPARDRACRPFNSVERGTYREWDGPRGPAPRDYELPREWEIEWHP